MPRLTEVSVQHMGSGRDDLRKLQESFKRIFTETTRETVAKYIQNLEETKRKLTIEGKLDDAIAVKMQIDALKKKYSVQ